MDQDFFLLLRNMMQGYNYSDLQYMKIVNVPFNVTVCHFLIYCDQKQQFAEHQVMKVTTVKAVS